ncbi:USO1-intracellular transport, partial [Fusarium napiforme]
MGGVVSAFSSSSGEDSVAARQALEKQLADREETIAVLEEDLSKKEKECTTVSKDAEDLREKIKELEAQSSLALDETHAR